MGKADHPTPSYPQLHAKRFAFLFFCWFADKSVLLRRYFWVAIFSLTVMLCFHFYGKPDVFLFGLAFLFLYCISFFVGYKAFSVPLTYFKKKVTIKSGHVNMLIIFLFFALMPYLMLILFTCSTEYTVAKKVYLDLFFAEVRPDDGMFELECMFFYSAHAVFLAVTKKCQQDLKGFRDFLQKELKSENKTGSRED